MFGDRWSLLIVRDVMLKGRRSFKEFLDGGEGIATNVLSDRIQKLEDCGVLTHHADPDDARRIIYRLTKKGIELAPVIVEMIVWGARHEETDAPPAAIREMVHDREKYIASIKKKWSEE